VSTRTLVRGQVKRKNIYALGAWAHACLEKGVDPSKAYPAEWYEWDHQDPFKAEIRVLTHHGTTLFYGMTKYFDKVVKSDKTLEDFL
jgi:hypothetical protein